MAGMRGDSSSRNPGCCIWLVAVAAASHEARWQSFSHSFGEEQSQLVFLYPAHYNGGAPFTLWMPISQVHQICGRTSSRGSFRIRQLLYREHRCRGRARWPALCGRFSGAGADCNAAGTSGAASGRRQCLYRSDHCILPLDSRSDPPLQLGHLRSAL